MNYTNKHYPETAYGGYTRHDGSVAYYTRLQSLVSDDMILLEVGCGRGSALVDDPVPLHRTLRQFKGKCKRVIGIDVDIAAENNTGIDEFRLIDGDVWPIESNSIDLVHCDFVLEHIENPDLFITEVTRILRKDGVFCARTTNLLSYVGLASSIIPNTLHSKVLKRIQPFRKEEDVFPTHYKINTTWKIKSILSKHNYDHVVFGNAGIPSYFTFSYALFAFASFVHALTPSSFRNSLTILARKKV